MDEREWSLLIKERAGLRTAGEARRALSAALGALACALEDDDARAVAKALPLRIQRTLERRRAAVVQSASGLYSEAERRERVGLGFAKEHVQVVLEVLARQLDPELVARLRRRLPPDIAVLLQRRRPAGEPPPYVRAHPARGVAPRQTLSRSRPGTANPIAEASEPLAHAGSVVRSARPHTDRMVETARSTRPGREDETLASARGGSRRK